MNRMRILSFIHNNKIKFAQDLDHIANLEYDDDSDNKIIEHEFEVNEDNSDECIIVEMKLFPVYDYSDKNEVTLEKVEFEITEIIYYTDDHEELNITSNAYKEIIKQYIN